MKNVPRLVALACLLPLLAAGCSATRRAGTGDVAFRLVWDGTSDLDLLVEDPGGTCIFWGRRESPLGGMLDVDCNAGTDRVCDHPIENVFWPTGAAPSGAYRVWVRAHALLPAEAPLAYQLQILHGTTVSWTHRGAMSGSRSSTVRSSTPSRAARSRPRPTRAPSRYRTPASRTG